MISFSVNHGAPVADLVLEEEPAKGPDGTEHKEELIDLFAGVWRCVLWC